MFSYRRHGPFVAIFLVFLGLFFYWLNSGMLGHDYFYFFPRLLSGKWHILRNGFTPYYFTPHFCGGMPQFAEPEDLLYSLPQLFSLVFGLWTAVQLTFLLALIAGYIGWYRFGRDVLRLEYMWCHVLSLTVVSAGFHFLHAVAGHITFHPMLLIGWLMWLVLDPSEARISLRTRTAIFALISAYTLFGGGFMTVLMSVLTLLLFLPVDIIVHKKTARSRILELTKRMVAFVIAAVCVNAAKLVAVLSFTANFPRELPFERFPVQSSAIWYIVKAFWAFPQSNDLYWEFDMPTWGAVHEFSHFISPITVLGIVCACTLLWRSRASLSKSVVFFSVVYTVLGGIFFTQFVRGYGWLIEPLQHLPVLESMHMPTRYIYPLSLCVIAITIWSIGQCFRSPTLHKWSLTSAFGACIVTIVAFFFSYSGLVRGDTLPRTMPYNDIVTAMADHPDMMRQNVTEAYDLRGMGHSGFIPMLFGGTEIYCHESMFLGNSVLPDTLVAGPVHQVHDGALNMRNPACMVYPKANNCLPGDRINVGDIENLERFTQGLTTTWKLSPVQHLANILSLVSVLLMIACVLPWKKLR